MDKKEEQRREEVVKAIKRKITYKEQKNEEQLGVIPNIFAHNTAMSIHAVLEVQAIDEVQASERASVWIKKKFNLPHVAHQNLVVRPFKKPDERFGEINSTYLVVFTSVTSP